MERDDASFHRRQPAFDLPLAITRRRRLDSHQLLAGTIVVQPVPRRLWLHRLGLQRRALTAGTARGLGLKTLLPNPVAQKAKTLTDLLVTGQGCCNLVESSASSFPSESVATSTGKCRDAIRRGGWLPFAA
jgi:hypothetical protein